MPDIKIVIKELNLAQRGINAAINATNEWDRADVGGVVHTIEQRNALIATFDARMAAVEAAIVAAKAERNS